MRTHCFAVCVSLCSLVLLSGCGKPPLVSVKGNVKFKNKPVAHCKVVFFPAVSQFDPDRHGMGFGVTDEQGNFEIQHPQGEKGIYPGDYKVSFVLWVDSKGKVLPPDTKPSEVPGGVKNLFPAVYEAPSTTPEQVSVPSSGLTKDFSISG